MPPTIILIRHAEALHNTSKNWSLPDPELTELGLKQCEELSDAIKKVPVANEVELIIVSPMVRTLQTMEIGLGWLIEKGVEIIADAGWQENSAKPCDTGSALKTVASRFPQYATALATVDPLYPNKTTPSSNPYAFTRLAVLARGQACLKALYSRPEKVIAVVSHSGFLRTAVSGRRYANADFRIFEFDEEKMGEDKGLGLEEEGLFRLKEWKETEEKGGGLGKSEKGVFEVLDTDFPGEEVVDEEPV
ncbi:phosphoglycerate mutase-like protein [Mytilinidion resinicola]|uniref:Phosphoglycerate mutase-like protein n=1 Tax=Mytilinidion resinicola TaxID=574789 RepID=A0A6A6YPQ3_9PEZI|nr:phosphoglycerate mutase-like protein [Mytilinidion resinicola]KAF2810539.1 phosphoglycerate mutase-like protein [Mytilinidion resinicola]